jgi:hypothetical protein
MPQVLFEQSDNVLRQISDALARYETDHPGARGSLYRQNSVSIRIRIIDPSFLKLSRVERDEGVWPYLESLSDDVQSEITVLLLLTPVESETSFANLDFDRPLKAAL